MASRKKNRNRRRARRPLQQNHSRPLSPPGNAPERRDGPRDKQPETPVRGIAGTNRDLFATLVLGLLVAVSYFPATRAGFVWDDFIVTTLEAIQSWGGVWDMWFAPRDAFVQDKYSEGHYWPLLYTTFWLEHKLWGLAPVGYHVVNVVLHFVNTVMLGRLLLRLAVPGAWLAAAVFAVHPLHAEAVTWVIARKDLLSTLFYLAAVMSWLRFVESPRAGRYVLTLALFVAGMLCKSIVITLPAALLIWHWWKQGRVSTSDVSRLLPFFLVGLVFAIADTSFYASIEQVSFDYSWVERILIATHSLCFYVGKLLWPVDLAVIYPHWDVDAANPLAWLYPAAVTGVVAALWFLRHRVGRGPLACILFFTVTLSPVLGFIDYGYMQFSFVADRYQYLAGAGIIVLLSAAAVAGANKLGGLPKKGLAGSAPVVLLLLGAATWNHASIYKDHTTFFGHIISHNPQARGMHLNYSLELYRRGRLEESLVAARVAVEQTPDSHRAHKRAGLTFYKLKRFNEAEKHIRRALEIGPRDAKMLVKLGESLKHQGRLTEALEAYREVIGTEPGFASGHVGHGLILLALDRREEGVASIKRALALKPDLSHAALLRALINQPPQETEQSESRSREAEHLPAPLPGDP